MSPARFVNWWENIRSSLWFIPSVFVTLALALSILMPEIDVRFIGEVAERSGWLFAGNADAARAMLSVISGSLITVVAVIFSITILALQQASSQFTPRIMNNFRRDPGNQIVLGMYLATFLYALLILRQIRGMDNVIGVFVPTLSVTLAIVLTVICLGLLVFYVHHAATFFQASSVIEDIHAELLDAITRLYPESIGSEIESNGDSLEAFRQRHPTDEIVVILATASGYLRAIEIDDITRIAWKCECAWAAILPQVGWYVTRGQPLIELGGITEITPEQRAKLEYAFVLDVDRSLNQDPLFAIRQLEDIALKALSPGINDPTTAEHALSSLGDAIVFLAGRSNPSRVRVVEHPESQRGPLIMWVNRPAFEDYIDLAFSQIRHAGRDLPHVTTYLLTVLDTIIDRVKPGQRDPVLKQIDAVCWYLERANFSPKDRDRIVKAADVARRPALPAHILQPESIEEGDHIPA